jgi:hypothetical protein
MSDTMTQVNNDCHLILELNLLLSYFQRNTKVLDLDISGNSIGLEGATQVASLLTENMFITKLVGTQYRVIQNFRPCFQVIRHDTGSYM